MPLPEIEEIIRKFKVQEEKVEIILTQKSSKDEKFKVNLVTDESFSITDVKRRNKALLNDFEAVKGKLRSKAIFCPTEIEWEKACTNYQDNPSLTVTTWKCQPPVFV
ncbi:uncharacterized protein LOC123682354 [Harmonia axyridis]|uniref:uncharacterized protein LOC123682354 n=1 Tax=Harmonia axyridis TaxID=115357 RepID=UPI001E276FA5|nr:uncharacterized protein LOC123682354 [Harmonia axyridis]